MSSSDSLCFVDCHDLIKRDLLRCGLARPESIRIVHVRFNPIRVGITAAKLLRDITESCYIANENDFALAWEYAWNYNALRNYFHKHSHCALVVANDIYPKSAACLSLGHVTGLKIGQYSAQEHGIDAACVQNNEVFDFIFVGSAAEKAAYHEAGRDVFWSLPAGLSRKPEVIPGNPRSVGILMGGVREWPVVKVLERVRDCIGRVEEAYGPAVVSVRVHPGAFDRVGHQLSRALGPERISTGSLDEFLSNADLIVSGGTSAVLQALHQGKLVVYDSRIDEYFPDTLQMCKDGTVYDASEVMPDVGAVARHYWKQDVRAKIEGKYVQSEASDGLEVLRRLTKAGSMRCDSQMTGREQ